MVENVKSFLGQPNLVLSTFQISIKIRSYKTKRHIVDLHCVFNYVQRIEDSTQDGSRSTEF